MGSIYPGSPQQRRQTRICVTACGNASHCPPKCARQKNSECFFAKLKGVCYRPATFASEQAFPGSSAVEQPAVNRLVDGSNPSRGATSRRQRQNIPRITRHSASFGYLVGYITGDKIGMKIDVQYLQKLEDGRYRYRRVAPKELRAIIGRKVIVKPLGRDRAKALRAWHSVHADAERLLSEAATRLRAASVAPPAAEDLPRWSSTSLDREIRALGLDPTMTRSMPMISTLTGSGATCSQIALSPSTRWMRRATPWRRMKDAAILRALYGGYPVARPEPTIEDAKALYLKEKIGDDEKKRDELEQVFGLVRVAFVGIGSSPAYGARTPRRSGA